MPDAYAHKENVSYANVAGQIASVARVVTGNGELNETITVPPSTANQAAPSGLAFAVANVRSLCITSTAAVTLTTNSTGSPANTLVIPAGGTLIWNNLHPEANPFTVNVSQVYLTTTTATASTVVITVLTA